jgi:mannose-6-phosphate isomerase class I
MRKSNYDKYPATAVEGDILTGWADILTRIKKERARRGRRFVCVVEFYQGVCEQELLSAFTSLGPDKLILAADVWKSEEEIRRMTQHDITDDQLFGRRTNFDYADFLQPEKVGEARKAVERSDGFTLVIGYAAALVADNPDLLLYADMPRWEIQMRSRRHEIHNLGIHNEQEEPSKQYKRGYFLDWCVCDRLKRKWLPSVDYWLDTTIAGKPKMIDRDTFMRGLDATSRRPFRVVPFFDPAPWGGQWMKQVCGLNPDKANYGWCFDCVPEENSLYLDVQGCRFEMPSNNLVFYRPQQVLGKPVQARFGDEFPIRFDFLDTMGGGNLSLQVHPTTQYIRETFGMPYTQDESYYLLDAEEGATVFLGLKTGVDAKEMIGALRLAQQSGNFDAEKFVNGWPAKKHDHFLIPAGTIHCSGAGAMVLEISATPSIFTFKLWDWGRLGLDGRPRPINIAHGSHVIQWERDTAFARQHLVNRMEKIAEGDGWVEERTGLHENEFIETRRHWFTKPVVHHTGGGVNVLNVIEGDEVRVESPSGAFEPYTVHYAETFIVPAAVGDYVIRPVRPSEGKRCGTIKAYVRFKD